MVPKMESTKKSSQAVHLVLFDHIRDNYVIAKQKTMFFVLAVQNATFCFYFC